MRSQRSTAWLQGQMQWHLTVEKTPQGFKASTAQVPDVIGEAKEEHQAVNALKEQLRDRAVRGDL